jgi:hypothetical protein
MITKSKLGTITWREPEFYISYDPATGRICYIGPPVDDYPNFQITPDEAVSFTSGRLNSNEYRVVKKDNRHFIVKDSNDATVSKLYLIKAVIDVFPKIKIIQNKKTNSWIISKTVEEPVFLFVCKKNSVRNYIRTLNIIGKDITIPMIYDSELDDVDFYVKEQHSVIEFKDE